MISLAAKHRAILGKKVKGLRQKGALPGILYGHKTKEIPLELDLKDFKKALRLAGESSLLSLEIEGSKEKNLVLIHDVAYNHLTDEPEHVDFYQPDLTEEIEAKVPLVFEGESPVVKETGGTLVKNMHEVEVKALPQNLPHQIVVNIEVLKTFEDRVLIKDLAVPEGVKILKDPEETVAMVAHPQKVEEELEKPIEEKVDEVERAGEKKEEEPTHED